jgi:sugar-phosphatase
MQIECAAILFDLDGVLLDSRDSVVRHWRQWAERRNLDLGAIMQVARGRRTIETMRLVAPHLSLEEEARRFAAGEAADTEGVIAVDGALPFLEPLPPAAWAIVTSGTSDVATSRTHLRALPQPELPRCARLRLLLRTPITSWSRLPLERDGSATSELTAASTAAW